MRRERAAREPFTRGRPAAIRCPTRCSSSVSCSFGIVAVSSLTQAANKGRCCQRLPLLRLEVDDPAALVHDLQMCGLLLWREIAKHAVTYGSTPRNQQVAFK